MNIFLFMIIFTLFLYIEYEKVTINQNREIRTRIGGR